MMTRTKYHEQSPQGRKASGQKTGLKSLEWCAFTHLRKTGHGSEEPVTPTGKRGVNEEKSPAVRQRTAMGGAKAGLARRAAEAARECGMKSAGSRVGK